MKIPLCLFFVLLPLLWANPFPSIPVVFFNGVASPIYLSRLLSQLSLPSLFYTISLDVNPTLTTFSGGDSITNILHLSTLDSGGFGTLSGFSIPSISFYSNSTVLKIEMVKTNLSTAASSSFNPPLPLNSWSTILVKILSSSMMISVYEQNLPQNLLWSQTLDLTSSSSSSSSSSSWPQVYLFASDPFNNCAKNALISNLFLFPSSNCFAGTFAPALLPSNCEYTPPGTMTLAGAVAPTNCSIGFYSSSSGQSYCSPAPLGSYSAATRSSGYSPCASGSFSASLGSSVCALAPIGSVVTSGGATASKYCEAGSFSNLIGARYKTLYLLLNSYTC